MTVASAELADRWSRLEEALAEARLEALLVTHGPDVRYLTGFTGSSGYVLYPRSAAPTLITDFRYQEQAGAETPDVVRVHIASEGLIVGLAEVVGDATKIGFDPAHVSVLDHERMRERLAEVEWKPARGLVSDLRAVKSAEETVRIERAGEAAGRALALVLESVDWRSAPTEVAVAEALERELRRAGSGPPPFEVIVAGGPRSALPHATPSDRPMGEGDLVLMDFGATIDGYCSDITRTFVVGEPRDWQMEIHAHVLDAQMRAIAAAGPGVRAAEVDAAARDRLREADLDRRFGHSTGHGIGLEIHEEPRLSRRSEDTLEAGNVVTVEPGVYLPGKGGVRIEDDVVIEEAGCRTLTSASRALLRL